MNLASEMADRYGSFLVTKDEDERAVKRLYYWVMASIESLFWGPENHDKMQFELYASERDGFTLVYESSNGNDKTFEWRPPFDLKDGRLAKIIALFVMAFDYGKAPAPEFKAKGPHILGLNGRRAKFAGMRSVSITIDMHTTEPDEDFDTI